MPSSIEVNGVYCLTCHSVVISEHRHDFKACKCEKDTRICVDGGTDYIKRAFGSKARWKELMTGEEFGVDDYLVSL